MFQPRMFLVASEEALVFQSITLIVTTTTVRQTRLMYYISSPEKKNQTLFSSLPTTRMLNSVSFICKYVAMVKWCLVLHIKVLPKSNFESIQLALRSGYGEFWPWNHFFLFLLNVPDTMLDWFAKHREARIFFRVKKNCFIKKKTFFLTLICVSFYDIDWYIIHLIRVHFYYLSIL